MKIQKKIPLWKTQSNETVTNSNNSNNYQKIKKQLEQMQICQQNDSKQIDCLNEKSVKIENDTHDYIGNRTKYQTAYSLSNASVTRLNEAFDDINIFNNRQKAIKADVTTLQTDNTANKTQIDTLKAQVAQNVTDIQLLQSGTSTSADLINTVQTQVNTNTINISNLQTAEAQNTSNITSAQNNIDSIFTSLSLTTNDIKNLTSQQTTNTDNINAMTSKQSTMTNDIETLKTLQMTQNNDIEVMKSNVLANTNNISSIQSKQSTQTQNISNNTVAIATLQNKTNTNTSDIESLQTQTSLNEENITALQTAQASNDANITSLQNNVASISTAEAQNATSIQNLTNGQNTISQNISTNTQNIATIQTLASQNADDIALLKNQSTSIDVSALTSQIETNTTDITALKTEQAQQNTDISTLIAFKQSFETPTDPNYNPKTFSDYPAGTILQGYARFTQNYQYLFSMLMYSPKIVFSAEANSTGKIKINWTFTMTVPCDTMLTIFQNNTSIYTEIKNFDTTNGNFDCEISGLTLADGNNFYATVGTNSTTSVYFKSVKIEAELIAPNAEVINQISPFAVEYFNGKYYITDCSSDTAKIAEINVNDMHNMDNLTWTDTGLHSFQYRTCFKFTRYGTTYVANEQYLTNVRDGGLTTNQVSDNACCYYSNAISADWTQTTTDNPSYYCMFNDLTKNYCSEVLIFKDDSGIYMGYSTPKNNTYTTLTPGKYLTDFFSSTCYRKIAIGTYKNGKSYIDIMNESSASALEIGFCTANHLYYESYDSRTTILKAFCKKYDKIIEYRFNAYDTTLTFLGATEIGAYDEYFEGANNDYFVVKNGKLEYHKKPTE